MKLISIQGGKYAVNPAHIAYLQPRPGANMLTLFLSSGQQLNVADAAEIRDLCQACGTEVGLEVADKLDGK